MNLNENGKIASIVTENVWNDVWKNIWSNVGINAWLMLDRDINFSIPEITQVRNGVTAHLENESDIK